MFRVCDAFPQSHRLCSDRLLVLEHGLQTDSLSSSFTSWISPVPFILFYNKKSFDIPQTTYVRWSDTNEIEHEKCKSNHKQGLLECKSENIPKSEREINEFRSHAL